MVSSKSLLLAAAGALALPFTSTDGRGGSVSELLTSRAGTPSSEGEHGGFFYSFWTDGGGTVNYENKDDGSYAVSWQNCSNFVGGKGWSPGTPRTINYESDFSTTGNGYLAIYGWMKNPLVEYYIIETLGTYDPTVAGPSFGSYEADGSEYKLTRQLQYPLPTDGLPTPRETLNRVFAVRQGQRVAGSVDVGVHFEAWKAAGLKVGAQHRYQIVATEGYQSSGEAEVTVW